MSFLVPIQPITRSRVRVGVLALVFFFGTLQAGAALIRAEGQKLPVALILIPGAISGVEGGGGSSYFIDRRKIFTDYERLGHKLGMPVKVLDFPVDAGIAERAVVLRDQVHRFYQTQALQGRALVLLAQSQAGLDARFALRSDALLRSRVTALVSLGAPHGGTPYATWALRLREQRGFLYWLLRVGFSYDLAELRFLPELEPSFVTAHQGSFFTPQEDLGIQVYSLISDCQMDCGFPFRFLSRLSGVRFQGDGLVSVESQRFGEELGPYRLDHLGALESGERQAPERARMLRDFCVRILVRKIEQCAPAGSP